MRKLFYIAVLFALVSCRPTSQPANSNLFYSEVDAALQQHLNCFYPAVIDTLQGGYFTNFEFDWSRSSHQDKMIVTQARDLWTAAVAAQTFPENKIYLDAARHGYRFITEKMWDTENGGFMLNYDPEDPDKPLSYKLVYGHAFALFALAEYAKIDSSTAVKNWLAKAFEWMETNAHDDEYGGYFNVILNEELKKVTPENKAIIKKMGWGNPFWKDQNTSIHILEALTALYQVMPSRAVETRLNEMLTLVRDRMTQQNGSLKLYFTANWQPIDHADLSRAYILKNQGTDHVSFGHNIETAYLILDASKTLFGEPDTVSLKIAKKLTDHTLAYGFDTLFYGLYDRGYVFNQEMEIIDTRKSWWAQYEAWHTLGLMTMIYPADTIYPRAFSGMWKYIQHEVVDSVYGGQYNFGIDESPQTIKQQKAHAWKGPYHDGRALMLVREYLKNGELKMDH